MLRFAALRGQDVMAIGNASLKFDFKSMVPANVEIISWGDWVGRIEYNDRPRVLEEFKDPAGAALMPPIQIPLLINSWITNAAALPAPLTLDQAKQIKIDLVEALYFYKRQLPYSYLGYQWTALDEDITSGAMKMIPYIFGTVAGGGGLIGQINVRLDSISYWLQTIFNLCPMANAFRLTYTGSGSVGVLGGAVSGAIAEANPGLVGQMSVSSAAPNVVGYFIHNIGTAFFALEAYAPSHGWARAYRDSGPPAVPQPTIPHLGGDAGPSFPTHPLIPWEAVDVGQSIRLTVEQASTLMHAISNRNEQLLITKLNRIGQIKALTTLSAVVAYDVIVGW